MPCPLHHFGFVPHCRYCTAFGGGFVSGFVYYPFNLFKGATEFTLDHAKMTGREWRAFRTVLFKYPPNKHSVDQALQVYQQIPQTARDGLQLGATSSIGQIAGGMLASLLMVTAFGRLASRAAVITLGPRGTLHAPHWSQMATIFGGATLSYFSLLGSTVNFVQRQQQIYQQFPGTEKAVNDVMDKVLKDKDPDDDDSNKT